MLDNRPSFLLHHGLVQRPVQLSLHHLILDVEEVILPVFGLELVFEALHCSLELLAEFLVRLPDLLGRSIDELVLLFDPGMRLFELSLKDGNLWICDEESLHYSRGISFGALRLHPILM